MFVFVHYWKAIVLQLSHTKCRAAVVCLSSAPLSFQCELLVTVAGDGQEVKGSSDVLSLLHTRHLYFYIFVPTWPFPSFLKKKKCGTQKIYLGANGWRLLRKHYSRLRFLWMKGLWEDNYSREWTCTNFRSINVTVINPLTFRRRIKSRLPFAGIIRRLPYSTRFQDKG